jgi:predicted DNA-binding protein
MKIISLKVPEAMDARLTAIAKQAGKTKSEVAREAFEAFFENGHKKRVVSAFDLTRDLAGSLRGPGDLSSNKKYMRHYGR